MYKISYRYTLITGEKAYINDIVVNKAFIRNIIFDPNDTMSHELISIEYLKGK